MAEQSQSRLIWRAIETALLEDELPEDPSETDVDRSATLAIAEARGLDPAVVEEAAARQRERLEEELGERLEDASANVAGGATTGGGDFPSLNVSAPKKNGGDDGFPALSASAAKSENGNGGDWQ
jgi:hypothetical protein